MVERAFGRPRRAVVGGFVLLAACAGCGSEEPATPSAGTSSSAAAEEPSPDQPALLRIRPVVDAGPSVPGSGSGGRTFASDGPAVGLEQASSAYAQLDCAAVEDGADLSRPEDHAALCTADDTTRYLLGPAILDGSQVASATANEDPTTGEWGVLLGFDEAAASTWSDYTGTHVGENVAFTVDDQVISAPTIQSQITGPTTVTGQFTEKSATELAKQLDAG